MTCSTDNSFYNGINEDEGDEAKAVTLGKAFVKKAIRALSLSSPETEVSKPEFKQIHHTIPSMPCQKEDEAYNMHHRRRGMAIIFNHKNFDPRHELNQRNGTDIDAKRLCSALKQLDFDIHIYEDATHSEITKTLMNISIMPNHKDSDCILVVVLTRGKDGLLYASDHPYRPEVIWEQFTGDQCPLLAGKPKVFFIQASESEDEEEKVRGSLRTSETDAFPVCNKIPSYADFLIVYYKSQEPYPTENADRGSWFIRTLCHILSNNFEQGCDLLSCMTRMNLNMMNEKAENDVTDGLPIGFNVDQRLQQVPCIISTLTRDIIYAPKLTNNN